MYLFFRLLFASLIGVAAMSATSASAATEKAIFAGGCFWCMEAELQELEGVITVTSGYTGGETPNPTYDNMHAHIEAVQVEFDPSRISYEKLLESYWDNIDPTDAGGQFYDRGSHYRTAIFVANDAQRAAAEASKKTRQARLDKPIVTTIENAMPFYPAEAYHQDYYQKNPAHYNAYKQGSQRKETLKKIWKR